MQILNIIKTKIELILRLENEVGKRITKLTGLGVYKSKRNSSVIIVT